MQIQPSQPSSPPDQAIVCLTPFGVVSVDFPEDTCGAILFGNDDAVAFVVRAMEQSTDIDGISLSPQAITPTDLLQFCKVEGLTVIPPLEPGMPGSGNPAGPQGDDATTITAL